MNDLVHAVVGRASKRSPEVAERTGWPWAIPGLHVYMVNCLSRVEVRARLWGFRSDNGDAPGMRFASSGLRLLIRARPTTGSDRGCASLARSNLIR